MTFTHNIKTIYNKGKYPGAFYRYDLAKVVHDKIIHFYGDCKEVGLIRKYYNIIFTLQLQLETNNLSKENQKIIDIYGSIDNLIGHLFLLVKNIMYEINIRDDIILTNDHLHNLSLRKMKFYIDLNKSNNN